MARKRPVTFVFHPKFLGWGSNGHYNAACLMRDDVDLLCLRRLRAATTLLDVLAKFCDYRNS
jgi:hypothetical protein